MPGAISCSDKNKVTIVICFVFIKKIKITANNVFWFIKDKTLRKRFVNFFSIRQYCLLYPPGIINAVSYFMVFLNNFGISFHQFFSTHCYLIFQDSLFFPEFSF